MIFNHDEGKIEAWPERDYQCRLCLQIHRYKRTLGAIPWKCSCGGLLHRYWGEGGIPASQVKTERREVRFKLEDEVRQGKRPRAMDEAERSIITL